MNMILVLGAIPVLCVVAALVLYPQTAKHQFLRFDLVQFVYVFLIFPITFIWVKSFLYYFLRNELTVSISHNELFYIDTFFSVVLLYIYAFMVVHSATKTLNLRYFQDPLYDIFTHTEWWHLWLTHIVTFSGIITVLGAIAVLNIMVPFTGVIVPKATFYGFLGSGFVVGFLGYTIIWISDPEQGNFLRIMKLLLAGIFILLTLLYFVFDPSFSMKYGAYWVIFSFAIAATTLSFVADRSRRTSGILDRFKHESWTEWKLQLYAADSQKKNRLFPWF